MTLWLAASFCLRSGKAVLWSAAPDPESGIPSFAAGLLCGEPRCFL